MATAKQVYTANQTVTITLASLANGSTAVSNAIDNSTNGFLAAEFQIKITTGTIAGTPTVSVYILRSVDGGTDYDDSTNINNPELMRQISTPAATTAYTSSVRVESLPQFFKIMVVNNTGGALDSTGSNHYIKYCAKTVEIS
ncbi:hypothetical protein [Nitrospira sp. BLG_2]|uniref:hypothetical protein n=1 Tax=Nitrospira sp. BLG_2 TaxID=3397507 RepID=UPI003B9960FD